MADDPGALSLTIVVTAITQAVGNFPYRHVVGCKDGAPFLLPLRKPPSFVVGCRHANCSISQGPGLTFFLTLQAYRISWKEQRVKFGAARLAKRGNFKYALRRVASVGG